MAGNRVVRSLTRLPTWIGAPATAITGVLSTAVAGLVIEDILPNQDGVGPVDLGHSTGWRWLALAISLTLFSALVYSGSWRRRRLGSLFYLRVLPHGQPDWISDLAQQKGLARPLFRSLLRRYDCGAGLAGDIVEVVDEYTDRVVELVHQDDPATTTTIAPNLSLPVAIALGYNWLIPPQVRLMDIDRRRSTIEQDLEFTVADLVAAGPQASTPPRVQIIDRDDPLGRAGLLWLEVVLADQGGPGMSSVPAGFSVPARHRAVGVPAGNGRFGPVVAGSTEYTASSLAAFVARQIVDSVAQGHTVVLVARLPK